MAIYNDERKKLKELLAMAGDETEGATLLIPDLQRPYIWKPLQVTILIDSLIRGWPFGTLLTWKVAPNDQARALARSFRRVVDRTKDEDEDDTERVSTKHPPAAFHMVLDGQQRVQSLLLALQSGSWGFKLLDSEWHAEINDGKKGGASGPQHWSLGCLCADLLALSAEYAKVERLMAIDFQKVLNWVVTDPATGQSKLGNETYKGPLPRASDPENAGRFIRLSRLWKKAPEQHGTEHKHVESAARELLKEHGVTDENQTALVPSVTALLFTLTRVKHETVTYLELAEYDEALHGSLDSYNDAVVNIFTRLNTAGRTLTREDITFAWLKTNWNVKATGGHNAAWCFRDLAEKLEEFQLWLSNEDLVSAVSFMWSVVFNDGKLLSNNDLLRGDAIRPMAAHISEHWDQVVESMLAVSEKLKNRQLQYGVHYQSLSAVQMLWAWYFAALKWRSSQPYVSALDGDSFDKRLSETLDTLADRWLICSQWAGRWASGTVVTVAGYATRLADCVKTLALKGDVASAGNHLREHLEKEVQSLIQEAIDNGLGSMKANNRKQVRIYYTALWIWNRLNKNRWAKARVALREKSRAQVKLEIDHIVAYSLWQTKIEPLVAAIAPVEGQTPPNQPKPTPEDLERAVNEIGNCLLLEKNFNISKRAQPLKGFLDKVHDFKEGSQTIGEWAKALELEMEQVDSASTEPEVLRGLFAARTQKIRSELEEFVRGTKARIDLDEPAQEQFNPMADTGTQKTKPARRLDPGKRNAIKQLKETLRQPQYAVVWDCKGSEGGYYWVPIAAKGADDMLFGVDWEHPYLSVPKNKGYDTAALQGAAWADDLENDARWYDFGAVDLADEQQINALIAAVVAVLPTIKVISSAS